MKELFKVTIYASLTRRGILTLRSMDSKGSVDKIWGSIHRNMRIMNYERKKNIITVSAVHVALSLREIKGFIDHKALPEDTLKYSLCSFIFQNYCSY